MEGAWLLIQSYNNGYYYIAFIFVFPNSAKIIFHCIYLYTFKKIFLINS